VNDMLKKAEIMLSWWTLIDATLIKAPSSTKNIANKRDPEMSSTKKNWTRHFGAKTHIATEMNWLIQDIEVTTAKTHDSQTYEDLMPDDTEYSLW